MKFRVTNLFRAAAAPWLILLGFSVVGGQSNICNCPDPPGGFVKCEPNQMAFCIIKDGRGTTLCITTLTNLGESPKIQALSAIVGEEVTSEEAAGNSVYRAIVEAQGVRTEDTAITFSLPASPADPNPENQKRKVDELPKTTDPTLSTRVDRFLSEFPRIIGNRMSHSPPPPHQ